MSSVDRRIELRTAIARRLGGDVLVEVDDWVGFEEESGEVWNDPVYVTARRFNHRYFDAVCDAGSTECSVDELADFCVEQLVKG